jgi:acetyl esterase/lipase
VVAKADQRQIIGGSNTLKINKIINMRKTFPLIAFIMIFFCSFGQPPVTVFLWPDKVPGETGNKHDPVQTPNKDGDVIRLTDVTNPAFLVFKPAKEKNNGAGIVVCPGGGYSILAIDKEGYEIAKWLNQQGFTAFVLQYRVPKKQEFALMDVQRTIRLIRSETKTYGLKYDKLGVMGFSAGGSLSARAATLYTKKSYSPIDKADSISCRPDFALLIYPAYLDQGTGRTLTPELIVNQNTPPMFLFATADDSWGNSALVMAGALRDAKVPVELHFMAKGGHGYGLRPGNIAAETWPRLAEIWLKNVIAEK